LDVCYHRYKQKFKQKRGTCFDLDQADYVLFHTPFSKLVQKAVARLVYNDFLENPNETVFANVQQFRVSGSPLPQSDNKSIMLQQQHFYNNRDLETAFVTLTKEIFVSKALPALHLAKELGNIYCGSLYACLISLIGELPNLGDTLCPGKRILMFSYGSGLASTMFSLQINSSVAQIANTFDFKTRIGARTRITPEEFTKMLALQHHPDSECGVTSLSTVDILFPGTYYLASVDAQQRRHYAFKPE